MLTKPRFLKRFWSDTDGSVSLEFLLMMPILFWAYMAMFVFFDAYQQSTANLKAAYTIGDVLSRETDGVNDGYIDSMHKLFQFLIRSNEETAMRISVVRWDEDDQKYYLDWSEGRGGAKPMTGEHLVTLKEDLPVMPDNERVIVVETSNPYKPPVHVGLTISKIDNFIFTRPRFAPQVAWVP